VAAGILSSRLLGFVRQALYAHFFGVSPHADVVETAFRSPNLLQNLLGEGTISASFIPIYSRMVEEGREEDAGRFAGAILGLLIAVAAAAVLVGVVFAEPIVAVLAPGFLADAGDPEATIDRYRLTVACVRIVFPMAGVLVLSAWALGVLNSHRRFFLPYFAPVLWNVAILAGLVGAAVVLVGDPTSGAAVAAMGDATRDRLVFAICWGALAGGSLQFAVQLPLVFREMRGFRLSLSTRVEGVRQAMRTTVPVLAGRGVHQVSSYLDLILASWLAVGAPSSLRYAQVLALLPVSLFGMSVAAAELPELSRLGRREEERFVGRVERSARQMLFLVLPTVVGYLAFGLPIVGMIYRRGAFGPSDQWLVYLVLAGYTLGLAATTQSRLLQNSFYATGDTRTPAKVAVLRVVVGAAVAVPAMLLLDRFTVVSAVDAVTPGRTLHLGAVGLALGSAVAAWVELAALRRVLSESLPSLHLPLSAAGRMLALAVAAALPAAGLWWLLAERGPLLVAPAVVAVFAGLYLVAAHLLRFPELGAWTGRFLSRLRR
jgi:putative peptidoglycan lipid II flippase